MSNSKVPNEPPFKAYVGNLPEDTVHGDIEQILRSIELADDEIRLFDVRLVRDRETDNFKGFAYIEFNTREQLEKMLTLHGVDFAGRKLKVDVASPPKARDGFGPGRGGRGGSRGNGNNRGRGGGHASADGWQVAGPTRHNPRDNRGGHGGGRPPYDERGSKGEFQDITLPAGENPARKRLELKPRTTDPAALAAKQKAEEEEEAKRRAKIFGGEAAPNA
ncbi:unnamed protein product, partial [Mesorhabditis belari]|uniref:RRM domain-containing protein n=1 Tax=Mesorhabditis belari TaxID=2138241 RepID=A0AAF3EAH4_9BILA